MPAHVLKLQRRLMMLAQSGDKPWVSLLIPPRPQAEPAKLASAEKASSGMLRVA
jgi:hypothetical protein